MLSKETPINARRGAQTRAGASTCLFAGALQADLTEAFRRMVERVGLLAQGESLLSSFVSLKLPRDIPAGALLDLRQNPRCDPYAQRSPELVARRVGALDQNAATLYRSTFTSFR
jgi:hypothetical protein